MALPIVYCLVSGRCVMRGLV